jgi:integrase
MPRRPKPYKYRGWYVTDSGGIPHHKLCPVELGMVEAERELRRYLNRLDDERTHTPTPGPGVRPATLVAADCPYGKKVHEAHDEFLDAKKTDGEALTYKHYVDKLLPFFDRFGGRAVVTLTESDGIAYKNYLMHEKEWVRGKTRVRGLGPCSVNHHLRAAKTFLNWCAKPGRRYIIHNPWVDIKYLKEHGRERLVTDQDFAALLKHCTTCRYAGKPEHRPETCTFCRSDDEFRQVLIILRHTTMRPGELRQLEWDEVELANHRLVMSPKKIKTRRRRVITLLPEVEAVLEARRQSAILERGEAQGLVFSTIDREAWEPVSFSQRFRRLRTRAVAAGDLVEAKKGEKLVLYSTRHTRITEMFVEGNEQHVVMAESGHLVPTTTERYKHLADEYVTSRVRQNARAAGGGGGSGG